MDLISKPVEVLAEAEAFEGHPEDLNSCEGCPFGGAKVASRGPKDASLVIVGESPGRVELKQGLPFMGPSGQILESALSQFGRDFSKRVYLTNALQCLPPSGKKDASSLEHATGLCHSRLLKEIQAYPRKCILAAGNPAVWSLTQNYGTKITKIRGGLIPSPLATSGILPAVHPAYLLRGGGSFRQFKADIAYAVKLSQGGAIRRPLGTTWSTVDALGLEALANRIKELDPKKDFVAADIETTGFKFLSDRILCAGYSFDGRHVYVVPEYLCRRMGILFDNDVPFIWHNGKFDVKFLHHNGSKLARVDGDTMLGSYALDETRGVHDLEQVASDWLGSPNWKYVLDSHKKKGDDYSVIPRPILHRYMAYDIANTWQLNAIFKPMIDVDEVTSKLYYKTLIPASKFLAEVEENGVPIDAPAIKERQGIYKAEIQAVKDKWAAYCKETVGHEVKLSSPKQMTKFLFEDLKLPSKVKSTDAKVLKELPPVPAIKILREFRSVSKKESTYNRPLSPYLIQWDPLEPPKANKKYVVAFDGNVHSTYLIHGTPTGRLASREPNLQNIPRDPLLRGQYIAGTGYVFLEVDLNQAELRCLACLSEDPELCKIYETTGASLHEVVRNDIYGSAPDWSVGDVVRYLDMFSLTEATRFNKGADRIVEEQKMRAKAVNFGIVYGRTAPSLAEEFHVSIEEAQRWIDAWPKRFVKAWEFINVCRDAPMLNQNLVTPFGYRKRAGVITAENKQGKQNEAANFPHQSIASTINLHTGIRTYNQLRDEHHTLIVNLVHDSILARVPANKETILAAEKLLTETATQVPLDWGMKRIPFIADGKVGTRWGTMTKTKEYIRTAPNLDS